MKKIFISIALVIATLPLYSRELAKNPDTGLTLSENLGVYSITGKGGAMIIGDEGETRAFFNKATKVFTVNAINSLLDIDSDKYELNSDDQGKYLIKVGLGAVKIRYSDALFFTAYLDGKLVVDKGKKVWKVLIE